MPPADFSTSPGPASHQNELQYFYQRDLGLNRLGGQAPTPTSRPDSTPRPFLAGRSKLFEYTFVSSCLAAQLIGQGQFGMVVLANAEIGRYLGTSDPGELSWIAASYGLTVGCFLIASGRLGDLYGPKLMYVVGMIVIIVSNVGSGFCKTRIPFDICRGLAGLGSALSAPNAIAILGRTYPPGRKRTIVFAILGALGPSGYYLAGTLAALLAVKGTVPSIWWFTASFSGAALVLALLVLPPDGPRPTLAQVKAFDFLGTVLLVIGLALFNFTWNQAPIAGWAEPYLFALLPVSIAAFVAFFFWERRMGSRALVPTEMLKRTSLLVYLCLWLGWMSFGIFLFYTASFIRNVRGYDNALIVAAQMGAPGGITGVVAALIVPIAITRLPGHLIFLVSMIAFLIGDVMASVATVRGSYWAITFPSLILSIWGPGGIVSTVTNYSLSIGLGMAGTVERYVHKPGDTLLEGYRSAFYFGSGLAGFAVVVVGLFVRMPKQVHPSSTVNMGTPPV